MNTEKFINGCDKAMAFSFYALIYFLPISIALSESFTGATFFFYLLKRGAVFYRLLKNQGQEQNNVFSFFRNFGVVFKPVPSILNIPIAFILIVSLVSVVKSQYFLLSVEGFVGKVLQSVFLYFNFVECMNSRKRLRNFIVVFLISCTLICINGFYQSVVGHGFILGHVFDGRISSSFRHANDFASYLLIMVPVLFSLSFLGGSKKYAGEKDADEFSFLFSFRMKMFCAILFTGTLACLGMTYSRGAWIGFIVSFLLIAIKNKKTLVPCLLLVIVFMGVFYPMMEKRRMMIKDIISFQWENNRLGYWRKATRIIKDYPVLGAGLNTYALVEGRYDVGWGGYPHNSYLQMTAETGLIGITFFLWMLFVLFRDSLRALKNIAIQRHKILLFGFLTGLLGFLIHSFFDTNFYSVQLGSLLWIIMGVVVVLPRIEVN